MKNYNIFYNKLSYLFKYLIIFIILFFIYSCSQKKEAFIFFNPDYYYVFDEEYKIFKSIKKKLNRNFYKVNEIFFNSFESLSDKLTEILKNNNNGLFYINDFLTPLLLKKSQISNKYFKLLTYNLSAIDSNYSNNFSIFNILIDISILKEKLINIIKHYSEKKDLSDCGLFINSNYSLPYEFLSNIKENNFNLNILEIEKANDQIIIDWLKDKKMKVIILFGYDLNTFILNIKESEYQDIIFIELLTNYGNISNNIKYKIDINWNLIINIALESKEFNNFIYSENEIKKSLNNYIVRNNNIIFVEKYKKTNIQLE